MTEKGRQKLWGTNEFFIKIRTFLGKCRCCWRHKKIWELPSPGHPRTSLAPGIQEPLHATAKIRGGDGPCVRPPNISRTTVIGLLLLDVSQSKKWLKRSSVGISGREIEVFRERNRECISVSDSSREWQKTVNKQGLKKGQQKFWYIKSNFFPIKGHSEIWSDKFFHAYRPSYWTLLRPIACKVTGLVLTCSDTQNVQWWLEMCSDERLFVQLA